MVVQVRHISYQKTIQSFPDLVTKRVIVDEALIFLKKKIVIEILEGSNLRLQTSFYGGLFCA